MVQDQGSPFFGREKECSLLEGALAKTRNSQGGTWILSGPAGIGKTRLLRWLDDRAKAEGFETHWTYCLKEANSAFFPFYQIFDPHPDSSGSLTSGPSSDGEMPPVLFLEEERPHRIFQEVSATPQQPPALILSREKETTLRQRHPSLPPSSKVLWLSRVEAEGALTPSSLDTIGEFVSQHWVAHPGSTVAMANLEYLVSQNSFLPVLKLVQFLRDAADSSGGHLLLSINPLTLEKREVALLEGEGEVRASGARTESVPSSANGAEPPALAMLRYLKTLEQWTREKPQVLFFDDLQWADPSSLLAVQFLARNTRSLPVLLVATLRDNDNLTPEEARETPLAEVLDSMNREGSSTDLPVKKLDEAALSRICEAVLGSPPRLGAGNESLSPLLDRTGGNPYFLMEMLRQLREEGHLIVHGGVVGLQTESGARSGGAVRLPETLKRLVARRLRLVPREDREVLEVAAVAGSEFEVGVVSAASGKSHSLVGDAVERMAVQHRLFERHPYLPGRWSFAHPLVWEGTLSEIPEAQLREDASRLAMWYVGHRPEEVENIARLFTVARDATHGPTWVRQALDKALSEHAAQTVERYHRWLQELLETADTAADERAKEGLEVALRLHLQTGRSQSLKAIFESLRQLPMSLPVRAVLEAYNAYLVARDDDEAAMAGVVAMESRLASHGEPLPTAFRALRKSVEGNLLYGRGDFRASLAAYHEASALAGEELPSWVRARLHYDAGWVASELRDDELYREHLRKGEALVQAPSVRHMRSLFLNLQGVRAIESGDLKRASEFNRECLQIARETGNISMYVATLFNLCSIYLFQADYVRDRQAIEEGSGYCQRFGLRYWESSFLLVETQLYLATGKLDDALRCISRAVEEVHANATIGPGGVARVLAALVHLERRDLPKAQEVLTTIKDPGKELNPPEVPLYFRVRSRLARARGEREDSRGAAEEALRVSRAEKNPIEEAQSLEELAAWEKEFGHPAAVEELLGQASVLRQATGSVHQVA